MSVTHDAIRTAERHLYRDRSAAEDARDYLVAVAPFRPAYNSPGTPSEELEIWRLARAAKALHPGVSLRRLGAEARNRILWWRWPLWN